jgi:hypothetical protein
MPINEEIGKDGYWLPGRVLIPYATAVSQNPNHATASHAKNHCT